MAIPQKWRLQEVEKIGWLGELFDEEITLDSSFELD